MNCLFVQLEGEEGEERREGEEGEERREGEEARRERREGRGGRRIIVKESGLEDSR